MIDNYIDVVFEYLEYPLRGKKPLSVLQCLNQDKICVIVLNRRGMIGTDSSHLFKDIIFNRLPRSLRKKLTSYVISYIVDGNININKDEFESSYREMINQEFKPWISPAGFIHGT